MGMRPLTGSQTLKATLSKTLMRRRSNPWIHRWSRPLIGSIAILGAIITGYLTINKFLDSSPVCTSNCESVLNSPYAKVLGLPLSLFGFLAYASMATFALAPLAVDAEEKRSLRTTLEDRTWLLLFAGSTAMLLFSGYLMYVLAFDLKTVCYYCIASATFAATMFVLTLLGRTWDDVGQLFFTGVVVAAVTLVGTLGIYAPINSANADAGGSYSLGPASGQAFFTITDTSGPAEVELARHLKNIGAKMYSAYWCPHCYEQKKIFGVQALKDVPSIECAPEGKNPQTELCQQVAPKIEKETGQKFGFPTWEINGKFYSGQKPLDELAKISGYQGPTNFKNSF